MRTWSTQRRFRGCSRVDKAPDSMPALPRIVLFARGVDRTEMAVGDARSLALATYVRAAARADAVPASWHKI
jgi:hypothetical protein